MAGRFPISLVGPKIVVVHRHEPWLQLLEPQAPVFDEAEEPDAEQRRKYAERKEAPDPEDRVVQQPDVAGEQEDKEVQPVTQQERNDRNAIVPNLLSDPLPARLAFEHPDCELVSIHHTWNFEGRRTEQPYILAYGTINRHHDLRSKKAVGAGLASSGVVDSVAYVVLLAEPDLGELK